MLPDFRAVVAAVIAAIALLAISFGVAATFRVAQDNRAGSLQADLAQRGRALAAPTPAVIETPAPLQALFQSLPSRRATSSNRLSRLRRFRSMFFRSTDPRQPCLDEPAPAPAIARAREEHGAAG